MKKDTHGLSAWQLTMMALGSVIGGSFFLGSAVAVNAAGPGIILMVILCGVVVHYILYAVSEMTIRSPEVGSFRSFASQAFGQGAGYVVGWVYWIGMALAMSSEATAVSILLGEWFPGISIPLMGTLIIVGITLFNLLGADKLSTFESALTAVKIFAIVFFVLIAALLISGLYPGEPAVGLGSVTGESLLPSGVGGLAGSILIVMFTYAGFEIIGLAASEAREPKKAVPKAIRYTVISLVGLYIFAFAAILPLVPTASLNSDTSPMVAALDARGIGWAGSAIRFILITAILSTMLGAMFGLGRMIRSLADDHLAPRFLIDKKDVPTRGILFSGLGMLTGLWFALLAPRVYLFLISSSGFAILFTYGIIMLTHIRLRIKHGKPAKDDFQMRGFPYSSLFVFIFLIAAVVSMPFIPGQASGLIAGAAITVLVTGSYFVMKLVKSGHRGRKSGKWNSGEPQLRRGFVAEMSTELTDTDKKDGKHRR